MEPRCGLKYFQVWTRFTHFPGRELRFSNLQVDCYDKGNSKSLHNRVTIDQYCHPNKNVCETKFQCIRKAWRLHSAKKFSKKFPRHFVLFYNIVEIRLTHDHKKISWNLAPRQFDCQDNYYHQDRPHGQLGLVLFRYKARPRINLHSCAH